MSRLLLARTASQIERSPLIIRQICVWRYQLSTSPERTGCEQRYPLPLLEPSLVEDFEQEFSEVDFGKEFWEEPKQPEFSAVVA